MKKILVLCTGNSCRSQIAEGYLKHFAGDMAKVYSAGVETHGVNTKAIQIMMEDGIDISHHTSNNVAEYKDVDFDLSLLFAITPENGVLTSHPRQQSFITIFQTRQKLQAWKKKSCNVSGK